MQSLTKVLIALSCAGVCVASGSGSPVEKVVQLLTDMQAKLKADGKSELAIFENYKCWCTGMTSKKGANIEQAKTDLKKFGNEIMSLQGKIAKCSSEINDAAEDMKANHEAQQKATNKRDKENEAFNALRAEMGQALQALGQALKMLKASGQFLQTSSSVKLSTEAAESIRVAIDAIPEKSLGSLPAAKISQLQSLGGAVAQGKYSPSYGSLVTILEEMYKTFSTDLEAETKTEGTSNSQFEGLMNTKVKEINALQEKIDKREADKAEAAADLASTTQTYDDTDAQMDADIKFFKESVSSCEKKAKAWTLRMKMRTEELAGVEEAIKILSSDASRALFAKAIDASQRVPAFLQVGMSTPAGMPEGQAQAFKVLKKFASSSQNMALAMIAAKVRLAQGGHFDDVLKAVDKVIGVLKKEQTEDNKKRTQCKDEYQNVAQESGDLKWKIEKNEAKIDNLETIIANKEQEKADTIDAIKDVTQQLADMKKQRKEEAEAYDNAKTDDENAVKILGQAKTALEKFAKKNDIDGATTLIQGEPEFDRGDAAPDAKFSDKGSRAGQTKGISMLLKSIIDGLNEELRVQAKIEKDAIADYGAAKKTAEALKKSLNTKKTNLTKDIADRNKDKDAENKKKTANEASLKSEEDYLAKITPDCDFIINNWQGRFNARKAEMEGLNQAKSFLSGAALVQVQKH